MEKLTKIQQELKAPKNQANTFGNYKYRSAEKILEAVKPILAKYNCCLINSDEMVQIGDRYYVRATATVIDNETQEWRAATAYAREPERKKGMDESQITGTASSYARKYALNGLFAIDDTKDADTDDVMKMTLETQAEDDLKEIENEIEDLKVPASEAHRKKFQELCKDLGQEPTEILISIGWDTKSKMTEAEYGKAMERLIKISNGS